jgi:hypothetical protein
MYTFDSGTAPLPVEVIRSRRRRKTVSAREVSGVLQVLIPAWMTKAEESRWVEEMQRRFGRHSVPVSDTDLTERASRLARRHGLPRARSVRWSSKQAHRWGSCTPSTGAVRVSQRLAGAPAWVIDYVLVHELAHLAVPSHNDEFHALVGRYGRAERARGFLDAWGLVEDAVGVFGVRGIDHVQLAMPAGALAEAEAEAFYAGLLDIPRVAKPPALAGRGGCWFERPPLRVHLGVEADFRPARKAHPGLAVVGLAELVARLSDAGVNVRPGDGAIDGAEQAYVDDPFGNRIELIERPAD